MRRASTFRRLAPWLLLAAAALAILAFALTRPTTPADTPAAPAARLVDARGRPVTLAGPAARIAIDDGRYLVALGLVHPDPVSLLAAWPHDVNRLGDQAYGAYLDRGPALATLPRIASSAAPIDVERLLAARPDVAVLSLESDVTDAQVRQIEAAGIPVVFVDFFQSPLRNLAPSLRLLGRLAGRPEQAEAFLAFRAQRMRRIAARVATRPDADRPTVFLEAHAGMGQDCCNAPGRGNVGDYLAFVGGRNIGADVIRQAFGKLSLEYVVSRDPAVYIATGGPHLARANGLTVGPGYTAEQARASLARVAARRGIAGLTAVREGRVHGIAHQLVNSPLDIVAAEAFARWIHPDLFADTDPAATLDEINRRFLAIPYRGTFWVDLTPAAPSDEGPRS